jgi:hypothetical protein
MAKKDKKQPQSKVKPAQLISAPKARRVNVIGQYNPDQGAAEQFRTALTSPFDPSAIGARIPDEFSFPTETAHVTCPITVTTDANGDFDFAMFPHPVWSFLCGMGTTSGGSAASSSLIAGSVPASTTYGSALTLSTLAGRYGNYRVVGYGLRLKNLESYNNVTGKLYVAQQPSPLMLASAITTGATKAGLYGYNDVPYDGTAGIPTSIITLPMAQEFAMPEVMMQGNLEVHGRITGSAYTQWRETANSGSGPDLTVNDTTEVLEALGTSGGWSTILLRGTGLKASDASLSIELIYHLEGTPAISSSTTLTGGNSRSVVDLGGLMRVVNSAARSPFVRLVASTATRQFKSSMGRTAMGILGAIA